MKSKVKSSGKGNIKMPSQTSAKLGNKPGAGGMGHSGKGGPSGKFVGKTSAKIRLKVS
jgi:hypothetical protein